jgi:hypothetical protein
MPCPSQLHLEDCREGVLIQYLTPAGVLRQPSKFRYVSPAKPLTVILDPARLTVNRLVYEYSS